MFWSLFNEEPLKYTPHLSLNCSTLSDELGKIQALTSIRIHSTQIARIRSEPDRD